MRPFISDHKRKIIRIMILFAVTACAAILVLSGKNVIQAEEEPDPHKFYTSITIEPGDSLWSIACTYIDGHYSTVQEYIDEIKLINNLTSDTIHAYEHLLVSYYDTGK